MIFVRRVDKVLNFRYNKKIKIESCTNCTANFLCECILPALRELKQFSFDLHNVKHISMYLTRTAGIETFISFPEVFMAFKCILPALRELKQYFERINTGRLSMYLTRTAGIETSVRFS